MIFQAAVVAQQTVTHTLSMTLVQFICFSPLKHFPFMEDFGSSYG